MLCEYRLFQPCFKFFFRDSEIGSMKNKTESLESCQTKCQSFDRSVPNFAELKMADFEDLVDDCEFIRRNFSASYKGYYETRQLCDFEIDIQYNYSSLSWMVTFSRHHKLVKSNKLSCWNRFKDGKSNHDLLNLPWKNVTDASQPYPFENNILSIWHRPDYSGEISKSYQIRRYN